MNNSPPLSKHASGTVMSVSVSASASSKATIVTNPTTSTSTHLAEFPKFKPVAAFERANVLRGALRKPSHPSMQAVDFGSEGLRHIPMVIYTFMGSIDHQCPDCVNVLARSCKSVHRWFFCRFDHGPVVDQGGLEQPPEDDSPHVERMGLSAGVTLP